MSIKQWPKAERPREKLLAQGPASLSNAELLAIFLRTGIKNKNAVELARQLLIEFGDLHTLFHASQQDFCKILGLGESKYILLKAILEISCRYLFEEIQQKEYLTNTNATKTYLQAKLGHQKKEVFACLLLDSKNRIIAFQELFYGCIDRATIYPSEVVKFALHHHASALILAHNHPSGDPSPSEHDKILTKRLQAALELVDIRVLDHIIVGQNKALSIRSLD